MTKIINRSLERMLVETMVTPITLQGSTVLNDDVLPLNISDVSDLYMKILILNEGWI